MTVTTLRLRPRAGPADARSSRCPPSLPDVTDRRGFSTADIHVHPTGRLLYGSNRGHNSLVIFRIDASTGRLTLVGHETRHIARPRNFHIDPSGTLLLAANQAAGNVTVFRIDPASGLLEPVGPPTPVGGHLLRGGGHAARAVTDCRSRHAAIVLATLGSSLLLALAVRAAAPPARAADRVTPRGSRPGSSSGSSGSSPTRAGCGGSGLIWLKPGANPFGSAPANAVVLPAHSAPPRRGCVAAGGHQVFVEVAPGIKATCWRAARPGRHRPAAAGDRGELRPTSPARPTCWPSATSASSSSTGTARWGSGCATCAAPRGPSSRA